MVSQEWSSSQEEVWGGEEGHSSPRGVQETFGQVRPKVPWGCCGTGWSSPEKIAGVWQSAVLGDGNLSGREQELHSLLETRADHKLRAKGLARGREGTERERAVILSDFRRELSVTVAKAQSACLIGRVARVGEGHRLAARRRAWVRREDERREEASRAHWYANVIGRGVFRSTCAMWR